MTTRLILRLDEHWPTTPVATWVLLGPDGKLQAEGESAPRHWPAADECDVLLAGAQCLWMATALPRTARRDAPRLLAYALEDRLLSDPDSQHLSISHRQPTDGGETVGVLVVARERMRILLHQLKAIGRVPAHVFSELQSAPADDENWHIAVSADAAIVRTGPAAGYAADVDFLGVIIEQQLAAARSDNIPPRKVIMHPAPGIDLPDLSGVITLDPGVPYAWWQGLQGRNATNLLQGEFAVTGRRSPLMQALRRPLQLASVAFAVWLLANLCEVLWLRHQLSDLQMRQARTLQTSFPNMAAIAPVAQMLQQLNLERARHGQLRDDDALALLAVLAETLGSEAAYKLTAVRFGEGLLDTTWRGLPAERLAPVTALLAARGLFVEAKSEGSEQHLLVRREVLP